MINKEAKTITVSTQHLNMLEGECGLGCEVAMIKGSDIHFSVSGKALIINDDVVVFVNDLSKCDNHTQKKWMYFVGAENEAEIVLRYDGLTIWRSDGLGARFERYISDDDRDRPWEVICDDDNDEDLDDGLMVTT